MNSSVFRKTKYKWIIHNYLKNWQKSGFHLYFKYLKFYLFIIITIVVVDTKSVLDTITIHILYTVWKTTNFPYVYVNVKHSSMWKYHLKFLKTYTLIKTVYHTFYFQNNICYIHIILQYFNCLNDYFFLRTLKVY